MYIANMNTNSDITEIQNKLHWNPNITKNTAMQI